MNYAHSYRVSVAGLFCLALLSLLRSFANVLSLFE